MGRTQPPVGITGLWLRRIGDDAEVLIEVDGQWRRVIVERVDGAFSNIAEQAMMLRAPVVSFAEPVA